MDPIVSSEWLARHLDDVVVCHVGTTMTGGDPRQNHLDAHLPKARYVSLDDDLAGSPGTATGRHPLPTAADFAATLASLGVHDDDAVVAYDDRGGAFASRMVWMMRVIGQDAALLDGGITAWPGPLESGPVEPEAKERTVVAWPDDATADADEVARHGDSGGVVIDSREPERYRGDAEPTDAVAGHVPGAINLAFADNLVDGRFRSRDELTDRFAPIGDAATDDTAIVYCGSGVTACHNALAIESTGLRRPRVYIGSWSGWSSESERAVERG